MTMRSSNHGYILQWALLLFIFTFAARLAQAQTPNDYQTIATGDRSNPAIWKTYISAAWVAESTLPNSTHETITICSGHTVTVNIAVTTDQTIVESGAMLILTSTLTVDDDAGDDLVVNGTPTQTMGIIQGAGTTAVSGTGTAFQLERRYYIRKCYCKHSYHQQANT